MDGIPVLATSATKLQTPKEIAGQSFDGSQDIFINLDDLSGVDVSGDVFPNDGQALVWNELSGVWMPGNVVSSGGGGGGYVYGIYQKANLNCLIPLIRCKFMMLISRFQVMVVL